VKQIGEVLLRVLDADLHEVRVDLDACRVNGLVGA
jgi:hypothetical protein